MHFPAPYQGFPMRTHITRALCAATAGVALVSLGSAGAANAADAGLVHPGTAYVVNQDSGTVTPIRTATDIAGTAINVKTYPYAIAVTPNGKTAYVTNTLLDTVTPIQVATNTAGKAINVGEDPQVIAITPNGKTA